MTYPNDYDRLDEVANAALNPSMGMDNQGWGEAQYPGLNENNYPESEGDQFFGNIIKGVAGLVKRAIPALGRILPAATQAVQQAAAGPVAPPMPQQAMPHQAMPPPQDMQGGYGPMDGDFGGDQFPDTEDEDEDFGFDGESGYLGEAESEAEQMAESMLSLASRAVTDQEAAALASGITITITGSAPVQVRRVTPVLTKGVANLVRVLRKTPTTRPLVPVAGQIVKATTNILTKRANAGKPVTPAIAAKVMAKQTAKTLAKPSKVAKSMVRNVVKSQKLNADAIRRSER